MQDKTPDAVIQRVRKGRWMTYMVRRDGSIHDPLFWPTKTAANAWLCAKLHKRAIILQKDA
jgi:hypothetical protein